MAGQAELAPILEVMAETAAAEDSVVVQAVMRLRPLVAVVAAVVAVLEVLPAAAAAAAALAVLAAIRAALAIPVLQQHQQPITVYLLRVALLIRSPFLQMAKL